MASVEELENSIRQYELQLSQVSEALKLCPNDTEQASLENLKCDLEELLELSRETLNESKGASTSQEVVDELSNQDDEDPYAKEMAIFMAELKGCGANIENNHTKNETNHELEKLKTEADSLIGKKCSAPYTFAWGAQNYHNALVCGLETELDQVNSMDEIRVTVLFTNPIHRNMVPCPYYLEGECRFNHDKCRFSHGQSVRYVDLKEYNKPNFSLLNQIKHPVLAKQADNIWYKGRVVSSNFNDKTCQIQFEHNKLEAKCDFHDILPIEEETPFVASSDSELSDEDDLEQIRNANLIAKSLLNPAPNQALGEWEKYTKGFGSKILQKFGYVLGTGLGQTGDGIVLPISAQILPPGRSLDYCMTLREQANGDKNLFSVEKKMKRKQAKEEANSAKAYEREKLNRDIFSFMNQTIFNTIPTTSGNGDGNIKEAKRQKTDFRSHTNKHLNVESLKIGEDIRKMEKEIQKLQDSLRRQKDGTTHISQQLNMQLDIRKTELDRMRQSENCLQKEQVLRKDKSKLTIF